MTNGTEDRKSERCANFDGARLRELRERRGLSRMDLAARVGVPHVGIVAAWEQYDEVSLQAGDIEPTATQLMRLAVVLALEPVELTEHASRRRTAARMDALDASDDDHAALAVRLRVALLTERRLRRGLSIKEVATRARVSVGFVQLMEEGIDTGSLDEVVRVLAVLFDDPVRALAEVVTARQVGPRHYVAEDTEISRRRDAFNGAPLRKLREAKGINVEDMAARAEIDVEAVGDVESVTVGRAAGEALVNYLDVLGVDIDEGFALAGLLPRAPASA